MINSSSDRSLLSGLGFGGWVQLVMNVATVLSMGLVIGAALIYAKPATNLAGAEQFAQRIFYIHLGCSFAALGAFLMSLIGSVAYLITRNLDWDRVTQASVETGIIFGSGITISGAIWARPTWNTYWTWDPRLTTAVITVLIYVAYLLFRNGIDSRERQARFGSIYGIVAFLAVPLTYESARIFRSIHPIVWDGNNRDAEGSFSIGETMSQTLQLSLVGFCLLFSALMILRWQQLRMQDRIAVMRERVY